MKTLPVLHAFCGYRELARDFPGIRRTIVIIYITLPTTQKARNKIHALFDLIEAHKLFLCWYSELDFWKVYVQQPHSNALVTDIVSQEVKPAGSLARAFERQNLDVINTLWEHDCHFLLYSPNYEKGVWFSRRHIQITDSPHLPNVARLIRSQPVPDFTDLSVFAT